MRDTDTFNREILEIEQSSTICLYEINLRDRGEYLFHAGENGYHNEIIFNGKRYEYFPIKVEGFEMHGDGRLPRPKMTFSNHQGAISIRLNTFNDFINYKVTRIKTFIKYLDANNFPNEVNPHADPDPDVSFSEDVFFVNEKTNENDKTIEFELVSLLELQNAQIPSRTMYSNYCGWQYRSNIGCKYRGKPMASAKNKKFLASGYDGPAIGSESYFEYENEEFAVKNEGAPDYDKWDISTTYNKGDVVSVSHFNSDKDIEPIDIYVCIKENTRSNPEMDTERWVLDDCDKTLCGCRLRFSEESLKSGGGIRGSSDEGHTELGKGLPFGGFPGIDPYEFK